MDRNAFIRRNNNHGKTRLFTFHPFLFIVSDEKATIVTVELFSENFDCRSINVLTGDNKTFGEWYYKTL